MDYSFLKLSKSIDSENPNVSAYNYADTIQLLPDESYTQITNSSENIIFAGDYTATINDYDVTAKVSIFEFTDVNGIHQIKLDLVNLDVDFGYTPVRLKITNTSNSDIWYSNEFILTFDGQEFTSYFKYKHNTDLQGICYSVANFYQSIRLRCFFDRLESETESKDYYQLTSGNTISARSLLKEKSIYKFQEINIFTLRRVNVLLIHDLIYIDSIRMTNKTTVKGGERLALTNLTIGEFTAYKNYGDTSN